MYYTEEDLREAFRAGEQYSIRDLKGYANPVLSEDEYIQNLSPKSSEEIVVAFTYGQLIYKLGWDKFCDLTGTSHYARNEGFDFKDTEIFNIPESKAQAYGLI